MEEQYLQAGYRSFIETALQLLDIGGLWSIGLEMLLAATIVVALRYSLVPSKRMFSIAAIMIIMPLLIGAAGTWHYYKRHVEPTVERSERMQRHDEPYFKDFKEKGEREAGTFIRFGAMSTVVGLALLTVGELRRRGRRLSFSGRSTQE